MGRGRQVVIATMRARLIAAGVLLLAIAGALVWFGLHERAVGAAGVQARWGQATAEQTKVAAAASESARNFEHSQAASFSLIANSYLQATTHAYPSIADTLPGAVAAGAVRLRNDCPSTTGGGVSRAAASARAADAAATQALADRVEAAVEIVRIGDAADARERELSAQVTALQSILRAERNGQ